MLTTLVTGALVAYLGAGVALYTFQRKLIYIPHPGIPLRAEFDATDMKEVEYRTKDGLTIRAWYKSPTAADRPTIVYFHGNAGHIGHRVAKVRPYLEEGFGVLLAEYRGYGGNAGAPTESGLYQDGRAALDFLASEAGDMRPPILYGESLGTGVAVQMATERPVRALVLEAPFSSAAEIARARFPIYPVNVMLRDRFDSLSKIDEVDTPLLVFHGELDSIVPVRFGRDLFEAAPEPKEGVFIGDAGHNDLYEFGAARTVLGFLNSLPDRG